MVNITFKQRQQIIDALDSEADENGITDIRKVSSVTCRNYEEINDVIRRVGFQRVDAWRVNVKVINV